MHTDTATTLALLLGVVLPRVTSYVTNNKAIPAVLGGYVTLFLAGVTGFCSEWAQAIADNSSYSWQQGLGRAIGIFVVAALARLVVHRDTPGDNKALDFGAPRSMRRGGKPVPKAGPYQPEHEAGAISLLTLIVVVAVLVVICGFFIHWLWLLLIILALFLVLELGNRRRPRV